MHDEPAVHAVRISSTLERSELVQPTPSYPSNYTLGYSDTARQECFIAVRISMVYPNMVIVQWRKLRTRIHIRIPLAPSPSLYRPLETHGHN
jgi:hypothetical protein